MSLRREDVHVWRAPLDHPGPVVERLRRLLSQDEQARADRLYFEIDRRRFIVARGCLRTILKRYLEADPSGIDFFYNDHGKPYVASSAHKPMQLRFNLAHSRGLAVYALTLGREIGIDLEYMCRTFTNEEIARRFFSAAEVNRLNGLPASKRHEAFFRCWTRKEAFVKAKGMGLSLPLDQFDVTFTAEEPPMVLRTRWDESEAARWTLREIEVGQRYVGAVAAEGHDWRVYCWNWRMDKGSLR